MNTAPLPPKAALNIAILTVSDSRTQEQDNAGQYLQERLQSAGHKLTERHLLPRNRYLIRAQVSAWIASSEVQVVLINGGTGFHAKDCTPEAVSVLFDHEVTGFGELFRQLSYQDIGPSALQSRALAGLANHTLICCLPGSANACATAWQHLIGPQLDAREGKCNFLGHLCVTTSCEQRL
ncbi:molybdenum cofactor biosynthesis protein B [Bowmanella yangjiangensis]|uniref:Molybdenum cofactor biosynthesis protein B n=1 Tax=Bowmanella yangjiangensis TaxID=2811230 RepID=A0ABS3CRX7_9ALTE|nr:molybdenum cofactor biosynthesis protein B [Bowmanella yangjiangensis]MBN7819800.1 molybdenum cofactor biosynthesis protein B [Bowmanella yangjiangensis]